MSDLKNVNLEGLTGREIINLVRRMTGKRITISVKSKKSIIKLAKKLLGVKSDPVDNKKDSVGSIFYLPDNKTLTDKITTKEIERFLKGFASEHIISAFILGNFATAFALIEAKDQRVADIAMDANGYCKFRRYCRDSMKVFCKVSEIERGLMASLWGARIWVNRDAKGTECFPEKAIEKKYPFIAEGKRILKIKD